MPTEKDKIIYNILAKTLRVGVVLAMTITILGFIIYLFDENKHSYSFNKYVSDYKFNATTFGKSLSQLEGTAIMFLGVIILMLTPVARIILSIIGFSIIKDKRYILVGLTTLIIIALSILVGYFWVV